MGKGQNGRRRLNIEVAQPVYDQLDAIKDATGWTHTHATTTALKLLQWVLDEQAAGRTLVLLDEYGRHTNVQLIF